MAGLYIMYPQFTACRRALLRMSPHFSITSMEIVLPSSLWLLTRTAGVVNSLVYAAGELKHGTIALIDDHQPVISLCCNTSLQEKTISNIVEVKARGAEVLAVTYKDNQKIVSVADDIVYVPQTETYRIIQ